MTAGGAVLLMGGIALLAGAAIYVWRNVPIAQCPRCESYKVYEVDVVLKCAECGNEWRGEL